MHRGQHSKFQVVSWELLRVSEETRVKISQHSQFPGRSSKPGPHSPDMKQDFKPPKSDVWGKPYMWVSLAIGAHWIHAIL